MPQRQRHSTQFLSWLLATMLLLVAVGGKSWSVTQESRYKAATEQIGSLADENHSDSDQATVGELSLDAVVIPSTSFDFAQTFYLLPPPTWRYVEVASALPAYFSEPFHFFSYFRKVFGHHIAINAP